MIGEISAVGLNRLRVEIVRPNNFEIEPLDAPWHLIGKVKTTLQPLVDAAATAEERGDFVIGRHGAI